MSIKLLTNYLICFIFAVENINFICTMNRFGYIYNPNDEGNNPQIIKEKSALEQLGCQKVFIDKKEQERDRPQWRSLLSCLQDGDELYIMSVGNALRGVTHLSFLLQIVKTKHLRLVSLSNRIDTSGQLFQQTTINDIFDMIASLPSEISAIRHANDNNSTITRVINPDSIGSRRMRKRHTMVINMYNGGYAIPEIMKKSGFKCKGSIFYILKRYGVDPNRKVGRYCVENQFKQTV